MNVGVARQMPGVSYSRFTIAGLEDHMNKSLTRNTVTENEVCRFQWHLVLQKQAQGCYQSALKIPAVPFANMS